jgi:hypothetical protein
LQSQVLSTFTNIHSLFTVALQVASLLERNLGLHLSTGVYSSFHDEL